jgi:RNA polymerase sigma-70 factor (ECF subfamily)
MNPSPSSETYDPQVRIASDPEAPRAGGDAELVRRMAAGDEAALGVLYDRWVRLVHSLALHLLRDAREAEEVVEETFWQAWRQADRYDGARGAVSTWLTTIARSRSYDRMRAGRRAREEPWSDLAATDLEQLLPDESAGGDPQVAAEEAERRSRVRGALAELPPEQREVLELAYFGGLSQTEIAERTKQPLGTVKTRVRLALEKLRGRLAALREETPGGST